PPTGPSGEIHSTRTVAAARPGFCNTSRAVPPVAGRVGGTAQPVVTWDHPITSAARPFGPESRRTAAVRPRPASTWTPASDRAPTANVRAAAGPWGAPLAPGTVVGGAGASGR